MLFPCNQLHSCHSLSVFYRITTATKRSGSPLSMAQKAATVSGAFQEETGIKLGTALHEAEKRFFHRIPDILPYFCEQCVVQVGMV